LYPIDEHPARDQVADDRDAQEMDNSADDCIVGHARFVEYPARTLTLTKRAGEVRGRREILCPAESTDGPLISNEAWGRWAKYPTELMVARTDNGMTVDLEDGPETPDRKEQRE
jgi:hypothetical protein